MYLYESHMGGLYLSDYAFNYDSLYCEQCGDSDWEIGRFDSAVDVLKYMTDDIAIDGSGGWDIDYTLEILSEFDDCPNKQEAIRIIRENRTENEGEDE